MAFVQINPPGLTSTSPGYISSITIYTGGTATALVPNATTGQVDVDELAATQLVQEINRIRLITG